MKDRMLSTLSVVLATCLVACWNAVEKSEPVAPPVVFSPVEARDLEERIEASGELLAVQRAEIAAEVEGRITELLVDEGSAVDAGQALLEIDPERRELELADARARLAEAAAGVRERRRDHARVGQLHARGAASNAQLDASETSLESARSRVRAAEARLGISERALRESTVTAPFAGLLARRFVSCGEFVRTGTPLFELVSMDPIEVQFHLPEVDSGRVALGSRVRVRVAPFPEEVFEARVTMISPTIDPRTRTLRVKAELANVGGRLRPGLFARADLGVARHLDMPMIPEEAVLQRADGAVVFRLVEESRVERRVIQTGLHRDGEVQVVDGLSPGDWVVIRGHFALVDGVVVQAQGRGGKPLSLPLARFESVDESVQ